MYESKGMEPGTLLIKYSYPLSFIQMVPKVIMMVNIEFDISNSYVSCMLTKSISLKLSVGGCLVPA